jgi:hypothetical protein
MADSSRISESNLLSVPCVALDPLAALLLLVFKGAARGARPKPKSLRGKHTAKQNDRAHHDHYR